MGLDNEETSPHVEYLIKEVAFSTCDNRFFSELEKEMLIPTNLNIYALLKGANSIKGYKVRVEFPADANVGYLKKPTTTLTENGKKVLLYRAEDLVSSDEYWWFPAKKEVVINLPLHLFPPFPKLNPVDLSISCRPDIVVGLDADVTTTIRLKAEENIDYMHLKVSPPVRSIPGTSVSISQSGVANQPGESAQSVTFPSEVYPFPRLNMKAGDSKEFKATSKITANLSGMLFLKCEQDISVTKVVVLSDSSPAEPPYSVRLFDGDGGEVPVNQTIRSTILQATAWVMYSPFSLRTEPVREVIQQAAR